SAQLLTKARILLKADVSELGEGWSDSRIAAALDTSIATIERTRRRSRHCDESTPSSDSAMLSQLPCVDFVGEDFLVGDALADQPAQRFEFTFTPTVSNVRSWQRIASEPGCGCALRSFGAWRAWGS